MPIYAYTCDSGHAFDRYLPLVDYSLPQVCEECGLLGVRVISAPLLVSASPECRYDSPIDGRPITSMAARAEDMARNGCSPYDPDLKTDYLRRIKDDEAAIDKTVDAAVEESIEKMPTAKRGKLQSELMDQGADLSYLRGTA